MGNLIGHLRILAEIDRQECMALLINWKVPVTLVGKGQRRKRHALICIGPVGACVNAQRLSQLGCWTVPGLGCPCIISSVLGVVKTQC